MRIFKQANFLKILFFQNSKILFLNSCKNFFLDLKRKVKDLYKTQFMKNLEKFFAKF